MTREEYQKKIDEIKKQKDALDAQIEQVHKEFGDSLLRELEEQGITPGTKVDYDEDYSCLDEDEDMMW